MTEFVTHVHIPLAKLKQMSDEKRDPLFKESEHKTNTKAKGEKKAHFDNDTNTCTMYTITNALILLISISDQK